MAAPKPNAGKKEIIFVHKGDFKVKPMTKDVKVVEEK